MAACWPPGSGWCAAPSLATVRPAPWALAAARQSRNAQTPCCTASASWQAKACTAAPVRPVHCRAWLAGSRLKAQRVQARQIVRSGHSIRCCAATAAVAAADLADHPRALQALYQMYGCTCLVERGWRFGLPLMLASIPGGFQAVALVGFAAPLAVALFGPAVGQALDRAPRRAGLVVVTCLQAATIGASGLVMLRAQHLAHGAVLQASPLFGVLLALTMAERLTAFASDIAVERDWVTQLAGKARAGALAAANQALRRVDLASELLGTLAFGWALGSAGGSATLALLVGTAALLLPLELWLVAQVCRLAPDAIQRGRRPARGPRRRFKPRLKLSLLTQPVKVLALQARRIAAGWQLYLRQPTLPASGAFILLYFNAVLSPGGLMTAFLASRGLSGTAAAAFRMGCAAMGFVGTAFGRRLIGRLGLLRAGCWALGLQASLLVGAAALYHTHLAGVPTKQLAAGVEAITGAALGGRSIAGVPLATAAFCGLIIISRIGIWAYDMVATQVIQMAVPPNDVSSVSSAEIALCNMAELATLGIAATAADPARFGGLVLFSMCAVAAAATLYTSWVLLLGGQAVLQRAVAANTSAA